jgi:hypothetical protein
MMLSFSSEFVLTTSREGIKNVLHSFLYVMCHYILVVFMDMSQSAVHYQALCPVTVSCPLYLALLLICSFHRYVCYKLLWYSALFHSSCMLFPVTPIILEPTFEGLLKFKVLLNYYKVP